MAYWTAENTEGFTADELATLNAAQDAICAKIDADEEISGSVADALNNAFVPGITVDALIATVIPRFSA